MVQLSRVHYIPVQSSTAQYSAGKHSTAQYSPAQSTTVQYSQVQPRTAMLQPSTFQCSPSSSLVLFHPNPIFLFRNRIVYFVLFVLGSPDVFSPLPRLHWQCGHLQIYHTDMKCQPWPKSRSMKINSNFFSRCKERQGKLGLTQLNHSGLCKLNCCFIFVATTPCLYGNNLSAMWTPPLPTCSSVSRPSRQTSDFLHTCRLRGSIA